MTSTTTTIIIIIMTIIHTRRPNMKRCHIGSSRRRRGGSMSIIGISAAAASSMSTVTLRRTLTTAMLLTLVSILTDRTWILDIANPTPTGIQFRDRLLASLTSGGAPNTLPAVETLLLLAKKELRLTKAAEVA
ncbi:hypothetical protein Pelo_25 [Pelomyxa schiedti]|nr:hypothetical protein Pelo_25 [Pelomyxa schiedti]